MLRSLVGLDAELYGFDLTPEMVTEARKVIAATQLANRIDFAFIINWGF